MYDECVVAVYEDVEQARLAVHILNRSDFPTQRISLVAAHLEDHPELETELNFGDDSLRDAFIGGGLGGLLGMLAGASVVALAGGGVALFAGPLAGLATGAVVGSLLGGMEGWGSTGPISLTTQISSTMGIRWLSRTGSRCWSQKRIGC